MADNNESIEELPSRTLREEEQYYFEHAYKEPVKVSHASKKWQSFSSVPRPQHRVCFWLQ
jgi:hypothetical protein